MWGAKVVLGVSITSLKKPPQSTWIIEEPQFKKFIERENTGS